MPRSPITCFAVLSLVGGLFASGAEAQSLQDRIQQMRDAQKSRAARTELRTRTALQTGLGAVNLNDITVREAFEWVSTVSGMPIITNWTQLEAYAIDPDQRIRLVGNGLTVETALRLIAMQVAGDTQLVLNVTPWYVQVMTKEQANKDTVVIVYPIGDLLQDIPNFDNAPEFDLSALLSSEAGGGELFGDVGDNEPTLTKQERAEQIMTLIRETVEPEIWRQNGGTAGTITFWNESLIIRAPRYVHTQIGGSRVRGGSNIRSFGGLGVNNKKPSAPTRLTQALKQAEKALAEAKKDSR